MGIAERFAKLSLEPREISSDCLFGRDHTLVVCGLEILHTNITIAQRTRQIQAVLLARTSPVAYQTGIALASGFCSYATLGACWGD